MSDDSPPGSSDWWPGSDDDDVTRWWPQPAFTVQRRVAGVEEGGDYVRGSTTYTLPAYLTPTVGTVTTPDPGPLPNECTFVCKLRIDSATPSIQTIVAQYEESGNRSWGLQRQTGDSLMRWVATDAGITANVIALPPTPLLTLSKDEWLAFNVTLNNGAGAGSVRALSSSGGSAWVAESVAATGLSNPRDSTSVVRLGARGGTLDMFNGRIYSVELRTGLDPLAGDLLWRFDANEYPGTGTVYTDPRGRTWTLTSASAITAAVVTGKDVQKSALRFPTTATFIEEELTGSGVFYARPLDYGQIEVTWGTVLDLDKWNEIAIVRSAFGFPITVNEGQTLFRASQHKLYPTGYVMNPADEGMEAQPKLQAHKIYDPRSMPGVSMQTVLPNGRWYYYALFFRSGTKWHRYMVTSTLLPRNHFHAEHLFNNLPPYYQWTDDQMRGGRDDGDLRKFLKLIGYDLDLTREYIDSWLDLYHTDFTSVYLLRRLGVNFGIPYEAGIGDIRYRGLISKVGFLYRSRGTQRSLQEMVVSVMKCSCDITASPNIMLLPDDSDFFEGTGSWAGIHPDTPLTGITAITTPLAPDKVRLEHGVQVVSPPANSGRGVMRMWTSKADATANVFITCGDGIAQIWGLNYTLDVRNGTHTHTAGAVWLNSLTINDALHTHTADHANLT